MLYRAYRLRNAAILKWISHYFQDIDRSFIEMCTDRIGYYYLQL